MKTVRFFSAALVLIIIVQFIGFHTVGKKALATEVIRHHESYLPHFPDSAGEHRIFCSNLRLSEKHQETIKLLFNDDETEFLTEEEFNEAREQFDHTATFVYFATAAYQYACIAVIDESEKAFEYGASWRSEYVWVLWKWMLIKKENTGIS